MKTHTEIPGKHTNLFMVLTLIHFVNSAKNQGSILLQSGSCSLQLRTLLPEHWPTAVKRTRPHWSWGLSTVSLCTGWNVQNLLLLNIALNSLSTKYESELLKEQVHLPHIKARRRNIFVEKNLFWILSWSAHSITWFKSGLFNSVRYIGILNHFIWFACFFIKWLKHINMYFLNNIFYDCGHPNKYALMWKKIVVNEKQFLYIDR